MSATLAILLIVLLVLSLCGGFAARWPDAARLVHGGCAIVSLGFVTLAVLSLAMGGGAPVLLPVGPPWAPLSLALDGLSAWFLLLLGLVGLACGLFAWAHEAAAPPARLIPYPLFLFGMALTLAAADGFTLILGFEVMSLASWGLLVARAMETRDASARDAARLYLQFSLFGAACLVPAIGLLGGLAGDLSFAGLRAAPPTGWVAAAVMTLVLLGAGCKAGIWPLHGWLPIAHPVAPAGVSALMSAAMTKVALYVVARLVLDLGGPAQPPGWGAALLLLGAASALIGALRATQEVDGKTLLACSTIEHVGLVAMGLGLAAILRGADLGPLASVAAGAALLHALGHALFKTLLFLAAGEIESGAGSRRLDALGGLIHAMPLVAGAALVGAAAAAALPPLLGFAGEWLLLQALLSAWRVGSLWVQVLVAACTAVAALSAALGAFAMLRFWGLVFLGRARTPRTLGAQEAAPPARAALIGLAALLLLAGLVPGALLALGAPAVAQLSAHPGLVQAGLWSVGPSMLPGYQPLGVALLLVVAAAGLAALLRRATPLAPARGPVWDGGFIAPPAHLPFGDPDTQASASGFAQPLRRMLGGRLLAGREHVTGRPPGDPNPARIDADWHDPALPALLHSLRTARERLAGAAERLRGLTIRQFLALAFGTLLLLLALLVLLGQRGIGP
ncbi:proton-conducting transporter membrane subunit [Pseudoroseomonas globiformis]|uniref:Proton-conducting transporter membrane subunit n=1 Tax=Teichococcus globiformis TaxID=2307229 RepID=A0ABV7FYP1_9PROT